MEEVKGPRGYRKLIRFGVIQVVLPGLDVCVREFSMFVNVLTIKELFLVFSFFFNNESSVILRKYMILI